MLFSFIRLFSPFSFMGELCIEEVLDSALAFILLGLVAVVAEWLKRAICFSVYVSGESM